MSDLDTLRPEVREAVQELDGKAYPGSRTHEHWLTIRAELRRLAGEEYILSKIVQRQAKILTGVANALKGEPGSLHLHSHHDLAEVAQSRVAELAALKARIAEAPVYEIPLSKPKSEDGWARVIESVKNERSVRGKRVRLVVEE